MSLIEPGRNGSGVERRSGNGSAGRTGALWGARFSDPMAEAMRSLNRSLDVDFRLWPQDVRGSRAWAGALEAAGVLTAEEADAIRTGLDQVAERLGRMTAGEAPDEDVHTLVERLLHEEIGPTAGKLHTGRSRNDQVATDARLWSMEAASRIEEELVSVCRSLHGLAERSLDLVMPGYTHLQRGQPIRASQWALAHFWALMRDRERLRRARDAAAVLPLGSGAIAGCPYPIDREALSRTLGFSRVSENSVDAVSDRDWICELAYAGAMTGVHLSRLGEDVVLFSSAEFGFLRLSDGYSTGSSLMPQKRNPDVAELVRGKAGRLVGNLQGVLVLLKGLPTGYNRDLQEDKELLFDTVDTLLLTLPAIAGAMDTAAFRGERLRAALDSELLATDLADYLVRRGVPFRASHEVIGGLVRAAEERGCGLGDLPVEAFLRAHPEFGPDVQGVFDWEASAEARRAPGGTARSAVEAQLESGRRLLGG